MGVSSGTFLDSVLHLLSHGPIDIPAQLISPFNCCVTWIYSTARRSWCWCQALPNTRVYVE